MMPLNKNMSVPLKQQFASLDSWVSSGSRLMSQRFHPSWFLEEIDVALSIFQATGAIQASEGQIVDAQGMLDHVQIPGWSAWNQPGESAWRVYRVCLEFQAHQTIIKLSSNYPQTIIKLSSNSYFGLMGRHESRRRWCLRTQSRVQPAEIHRKSTRITWSLSQGLEEHWKPATNPEY